MTAPMAVSWAARLGWLDLPHARAELQAQRATPYLLTLGTNLLTLGAIGELIGDKLPIAPSRKIPPSFAFRIISGSASAAALCRGAGQDAALGAVCGALGAVVGTLGGAEARAQLGRALHAPDAAVALIEDAVAVGGGFLLVRRG